MSDVVVRRGGNGIVTVTLHRPESKNAILPSMWEELTSAFREIDARGEDRAMVLRGSGDDFCSGADVKARHDGRPQVVTSEQLMDKVKECVLALFDVSIPTIAAVDGMAVGGGSNLAFVCDFVVATERARFCQIFIRRGLTVDSGGSWLLPRIVGIAQAKRLILLGEMLDAPAAHELGLVTRLVPDGGLDQGVDELVAQLVQYPPSTLVGSKRLIHSALESTLGDALDAESAAQLEMMQSPDTAEAIRAFMEKRPPSYGALKG